MFHLHPGNFTIKLKKLKSKGLAGIVLEAPIIKKSGDSKKPEKIVLGAQSKADRAEWMKACDAQILHIHLHSFDENQGITGVIVLAESHINIHTWPEVGFAALDIFMCGKTNPVAAIPVLETAFKPQRMEVQTVTRGIITK